MKELYNDAIEGGFDTTELLYKLGINEGYEVACGYKHMTVTTNQGNTKKLCDFHYLFLMPQFWRAVGVTRDWRTYSNHNTDWEELWPECAVEFNSRLLAGEHYKKVLKTI